MSRAKLRAAAAMPEGFNEPSPSATARAAHCWFGADRLSRDPATAAWKLRARLQQARWREANGFPIGASPYEGGEGSSPVGSRLELSFARTSMANLLTPGARAAASARLEAHEPHQMPFERRLLADLLSSMPLGFNLFGDLAGDPAAARRAVRALWPEAPGGDVEVRFEHSPGRCDRQFLGNKSAFDVAFAIDGGAGETGRRDGIVGVETKYHEHAVAEAAPKPRTLARYLEVAERSGVFAPGWRDQVIGTELQQVWLDHLLVLSMLQHPSKRWGWGRFVLLYPGGNPSFAGVAARYRGVLRGEDETFEAWTLEAVLDREGALPAAVVEAVRGRYL